MKTTKQKQYNSKLEQYMYMAHTVWKKVFIFKWRFDYTTDKS